MVRMGYLDLDLLIERSAEGYTARVLNSPAGQAAAGFRLPFSKLQLENFLLRVGRTRRGVRRLDSPEMEAAKVFGGRLYEAVFDDEMRGCLRSSLDEATRQGAGLRIRLRLANVPELTDLPWEYLYNPALNRFFVLSAETPLVRYLELPERIRPLAVKPPLKVLVMISSPGDYPPLDVEGEWKKLKEAVGELERRGLVMLERLKTPTLATLQQQLRRGAYHIFHFIGHGGFDERAQDGVLLLEDEEGRGRPVSGQYLGTLMHDERTLRLAILNACEGARTSRRDPFAGTAQSLVQQGVPAVIAMQFEITDEAAITLAQEFYSALSDGYPVDAALCEARKAIFARGNDVEWGTPVLYMRSPNGRIFDIEQMSEEELKSSQVGALYRDAQVAIAKEDWETAIEKLQAVLALEPTHVEATTGLSRARQQQELATLYAMGRRHYEAGRFRLALECFRRVQDIRADYKGVGTVIATIERAITLEEEKVAPAPQPAPSRPNRWLWVGIPAVLLLLVLVCGGGVVAYFLKPTPTPEQTVAFVDTPTLTPTLTLTPEGVTITPSPPTVGPKVIKFTVEPGSLVKGGVETVRLAWDTQEADMVTIEPDIGPVGLAGSRDVPAPSGDMVYTLVAKGPGGETRSQAQVKVEEQVCSVVADGLNLRPGPGTVYEPPIRDLRGGTQLKPLAFNPIGYPEPEWVHVEVQGSGEKGWVRFTESYVVCNLDIRKFADIPAPPTPTVPAPVTFNVWAESQQIEEGGCTTLGWEIRNVQQADLNGEGIEIGQSQTDVCPTTTTSYKWRIIKRDGSQEEKTVTVAVIPKPDMHSVSNVTLDPPSPASLKTGQDVRVAFKYSTTEAGGVYIWARPVANGVPAPDYAASGSPLFPAGEGSGSGTFTIKAGEVTVDQIRFQIWNADKSQLLYESFVPVSYTFSEGTAGLTAPTQISPADGSVFDHYPRTTNLRWSAVPGAVKYVVQIDCYHCCEAGKWCTDVGRTDYGLDEVAGTEYTFDFVGAQPGRWRVWAIGADGQEGPKSGWWEFRYTS